MFNTHCKAVQEYSQRNADNFGDTILMVALSIQQNWLGVGDQIADVRANKLESRFLWGNKIKTYEYLMSNKHMMFSCDNFLRMSTSTRRDCISLSGLPFFFMYFTATM